MIKQGDVAKRLGVDRSTVSLALRNDPRISKPVREKVQQVAAAMGYFPNPHLSAFMSEIRTGKVLGTNENIAVLVDLPAMEAWRSWVAYRDGMLQRSREMCVALDFFFMRAPGMNWRKVDKILKARGVKGMILAAPYHEDCQWFGNVDAYACVGTGFGWARQGVEVVAWDHQHDVSLAFAELLKLGYRRIGMGLMPDHAQGSCTGTEWYDGYLRCQARLPDEARIPLLVVQPTLAAGESGPFLEWKARWRPDAMIAVAYPEWVEIYKTSMGFASLTRLPGQPFAGVTEGAYSVGRTVIDSVVARIFHGEYGSAQSCRKTLIGGMWVAGNSVKRQPAAKQPLPQWVEDFLKFAGPNPGLQGIHSTE